MGLEPDLGQAEEEEKKRKKEERKRREEEKKRQQEEEEEERRQAEAFPALARVASGGLRTGLHSSLRDDVFLFVNPGRPAVTVRGVASFCFFGWHSSWHTFHWFRVLPRPLSCQFRVVCLSSWNSI